VTANYIVKPGEHLGHVAARFGFENFSVLWNHPQNAELKQKRESPLVLEPGDEVFIPDRVELVFSRATASSHDLQVHIDRVRLNLRFLDLQNKPRAGVKVILSVDRPETGAASSARTQTLSTNGDGKVDTTTTTTASVGEATIDDLEYELRIGALDPIESKNGVAQRLTNLGYIVWPREDDLPDEEADARHDYDVRSAVEEFECDNHIQPIKGEFDNATFKAKLRELHGA